MAESPNGGREGGRAEGGMVVEKAHWSKYIPVGLLVVVDMYRRCIFYSMYYICGCERMCGTLNMSNETNVELYTV